MQKWIRQLFRSMPVAPVTKTQRARLNVHAFEDRVVPAFTSTLSGSTATFTGDGAADTFILDTAGGLLRHNRFTAGDAGFASNFDFNSSTPGDQTLSAAAASTVNFPTLGGGDDVLVLGSATSPASTLLAAITVNAGGPGNDALRIDDSARTTSNTYTTSATNVAATGLNVTNLAIFEIGVTLLTGSAGDLVTVQSTSSVETFTLNTGAGADTIRVTASGLASPLRVDGGGPVSPTSPGDTLIYNAGDAVITRTTGADASSGSFSVPGQSAVTFVSIETQLAGPIVVSNIGDISDGNFAPGQLTLREAIELANTGAGADTITFQAGLTGTITLAGSQLPTITGDTTITGPGAAQLAISGNDQFRIFTVDDGTAALITVGISGLTLRNGRDATDTIAGAVFNSENLTLTNVTVSNNTKNGAVFHTGGLLTVVGSTFSGNQNDNSAAAILASGGTVNITDSTFTNNTGSGIGAVFTDTAATITNSTFSGNRAAGTGGFGGGGAIAHRNGTLTITGSTFTSNIADNSGGAIRSQQGEMKVSNSTFAGNKAAVDGGAVRIDSKSTATITNSTFSGNEAAAAGGAITNTGTLTLTNGTLTGNRGGAAGGLFAFGTDTVANSIIAGNFLGSTGTNANDAGGSIETGTNNLIGEVSTAAGLTNGVNGNIVGVAVGTVLNLTLANNGGPTFTHALLPGSKAINAGSNTAAGSLTTDQTGGQRIRFGTVDIGAFEFNPTLPAALVVDNTGDGFDGDFTAGQLTLREAVQIANDRTGADAITFAVTGTITLAGTQLPTITGDLTITGPGANLLAVSGNDSTRVFQTQNGTTVGIAGLTITRGRSTSGGGIDARGTLTITDCVISDNTSTDFGGGIAFTGTRLTVSNSTISGNKAATSGGGIIVVSGFLAVTNSTISNNTANGDGGGISDLNISPPRTQAIVNSTIVGNRANTAGSFGRDGGGIRIRSTGSVNYVLTNTIVAGNLRGTGAGTPDEIGGGNMSATSSFNLIGDAGSSGGLTNGVNGNIVGVAVGTVLNTTLANNGGPTQTHALLLGSPALDKGDKTLAGVPATDQRGFARVSGANVDIGAFEAQSGAVLIGAREFAAGADAGSGSVTLFNPNGSARFTTTPFGAFTGGIRTAAADFTGDGIADLVVGTGPGRATSVRIFDGVTQTEVFTIDPFEPAFTGGIFVAVGDINGDGTPELVITPDEGGGPRVRVFNGKGFTQIADFFGIDGDPNFRGGARAAISDLNGDGKADLLVAAGFGGGPRLALYDGSKLASTGGPKFVGDFFVFEQTLRNGVFLAAGDVNGDGFADVMVGGGPGGGPRIFGLSGKDLTTSGKQTQVANFFAGDVNARGGIRLTMKDLDNDGFSDIVVGSGTGAGSRVIGYRGITVPVNATPTPEAFGFDAFAGFTGGVFVG